jgi:hypothetical protein
VTARPRGLRELARLYGVETSYEGMDGERRRSDAEALALTLRALGAELDATRMRRARAAGAARGARRAADPAGTGRVGRRTAARPACACAHGEPERAASRSGWSRRVVTHACHAEPAARSRGGWTADARAAARPAGCRSATTAAGRDVGDTFETLIIAAPRSRLPARPPPASGACSFRCTPSAREQLGHRRLQRPRQARPLGRRAGRRLRLHTAAARHVPRRARSSRVPTRPRAGCSGTSCSSTYGRAGWSAAPTPDRTATRRAAPASSWTISASRRSSGVSSSACCARPQRRARHAPRAVRDNAHAALDYARFRAVCDRRREAGRSGRTGCGRHIRDGDYAPEDRDYHLFAQWQADEQLGRVPPPRRRRGTALPRHAARRAPRRLRQLAVPELFAEASPQARRRIRSSPAVRTGGSAR